MTVHTRHPDIDRREQFLVDGCPRCAEYARDLGLQFTEKRFRQFWEKMLQVEYHDQGTYASQLDKELGRNLYRVSLALQRAFGLDPHALAATASDRRLLDEAAAFCELGGALDQGRAVRAAKRALEHVAPKATT